MSPSRQPLDEFRAHAHFVAHESEVPEVFLVIPTRFSDECIDSEGIVRQKEGGKILRATEKRKEIHMQIFHV